MASTEKRSYGLVRRVDAARRAVTLTPSEEVEFTKRRTGIVAGATLDQVEAVAASLHVPVESLLLREPAA
jgi:hypothetical protein